MKFKKILNENKFSLIVSLPENREDLAAAAIEGGADAIKVHANVWHRASQHSFGSLSDNRDFFNKIVKIAGSTPVGFVPGGEEAFCTVNEMLEAKEIGIDFFSSYAKDLPVDIFNLRQYTRMVAIDSNYSESLVSGLIDAGVDVLECSIQAGEQYHKAFNVNDLGKYARLASISRIPLVIPTQKFIKPESIFNLQSIGIKGLMIGAVVIGSEPSAERMRACVQQYKEVIRDL